MHDKENNLLKKFVVGLHISTQSNTCLLLSLAR